MYFFIAKHKGITIIFATARAPRSVKVFLPQELQDITAIVNYNGALVIDKVLGYREHYPIESSIIDEIIEYVTDCPAETCLSIESEDKWYSNKTIDYSRAMNAVVNPIIVPLNEFKKTTVSKLLITQYTNYEKLQKRFKHKVNTVCTDGGTLIQIMAKGISKERAVLKLCIQKNIPMSNVMA